MKKLIKSISMICLALLLICPVFLTGCSKNLTVNVAVEGAGGGVYLFSNSQSENTGKNIVGDNVVKEGEDFEYRVSPAKGYKIAKVEVDGTELTLTASEKEQGKVFSLENVTENHNIKVTFEIREWAVTFVCVGNGIANPEFFTLKNVTHNTALNVGTAEFGGENNDIWYVYVNNVKKYLVNGQDDPTKELATDWQKNYITINDEKVVYCDLTLAELQALVG